MQPSLNKYRNIFKAFRDPNSNIGQSLFKGYDEPTYLTFSVFFRPDNNDVGFNTNYDRVPMPLLSEYIEDSYDVRHAYSTINYLRDINEFVRAELLWRFINDLNTLQSYFQWYFQSISGINNLLAVMPLRGQRVASEGRLTMQTLEGIDQRMTNLLNIYRKVAWDDTYQRWILPDMMRYFAMDIYITEFRTFHRPNVQNPAFGNSNVLTTILNVLENTMPTWKISCERCEIDISSINKNVDTFSINAPPDMTTVEFDIKVGQVHEEYINPTLDYYYNDKILNGLDRTREFTGTSKSPGEALGAFFGSKDAKDSPDYNPTRVSSNNRSYPNASQLAQGQLLSTKQHITGTPFYEGANTNTAINQAVGTMPDGATLRPDFDPVDPATWLGNAVTFGRSFVENFIEDAIDKAKMTKIPGLGISVNEAIGAIESKNFLTVFGLIRQAINNTYELSSPPSSELGGDIVDGTFRQFLQGIVDSKATDGRALDLKNYADLALTDDGTFSRITDFSMATDMVSKTSGEKNIPNPIHNPTVLSEIVDLQTGGDRSHATDLDGGGTLLDTGGLIEAPPSSLATDNRIITG